jgi:hypothetical protein
LATLYFVPYQNPCPKCLKKGLIRAEHVIQGGIATLAQYCGYCEHQWSVIEAAAARPEPPKYVPLPKPRTRSFGPKRK